jgi:hypothetical protein
MEQSLEFHQAPQNPQNQIAKLKFLPVTAFERLYYFFPQLVEPAGPLAAWALDVVVRGIP